MVFFSHEFIFRKLNRKQRALALLLAELEEEANKRGTVDGITHTRDGKIAKGDAEYEELLNSLRNALDEDDDQDSRASDNKES